MVTGLTLKKPPSAWLDLVPLQAAGMRRRSEGLYKHGISQFRAQIKRDIIRKVVPCGGDMK